MSGKFHAVLGIVASHMGDNCQLTFCCFHDIFQYHLPVFHTLIDAFSGGTIHIESFHALFYKILSQCLDSFGAYVSFLVITCVKCRDYSFVLV